MNDTRDLLERVGEGFQLPEPAFDRLSRRRDRKVRNQRLAAAAVAIAVFVVAATALIRAFSAPPETGRPSPSPGIAGRANAVFLDLETGETRPLPTSITSMPGATQFVPTPNGERLAFVARGELGSPEIFVASIDGKDIRQLTSVGDAGSPRWSPDGTQIVFADSNGNRSSIWTVQSTTGERRLVVAEGEYWRPSFSAGGREILFTGMTGTGASRSLGLWSKGPDEGRPSLLVANAAYGSSSTNGLIAFHRADAKGASPVIASAVSFGHAYGGEHNPPLTGSSGRDFQGPNLGVTPPMWSPEGSRIAYESTPGTIVVEEVATRTVTTYAGREPSWLDPQTLVVEDFRLASTGDDSDGVTDDAARLSFVDVATGAATSVAPRLSALPRSREFNVSPDGSRIAFFAGSPNDAVHLYVADLDGTDVRRVTRRSPGYAYGPRWSPDGTAIVYAVGCCESWSLYVVSVADGATTRLIRNELARDPTFSSDGRSILYTGLDGQRLSLREVPVSGGASHVVEDDAGFGAYSPDGSTIVLRRTKFQPGAFCGLCWWIDFELTFVPVNDAGSTPPANGGMIGPLDGVGPTGAAWSPDGTRVAFKDGSGGTGQILIYDVEGRSTQFLGNGTAVSWVDNDTLLIERFGAG